MRKNRGQMRIFEAIVACSLILIGHYFLSYSAMSISRERSVELESLAHNLFNTLQNQNLMVSIINNEQNWQSSIKQLIGTMIPPDVLYNISLESLVSHQVIADEITNIQSDSNKSKRDTVSVQGLYTLSFPLIQKEDVPLDIVMVMDRSGSMNDKIQGDQYKKIDNTKQAACNFLDKLNSTTDRAALTSFATDATLEISLTSNFSEVKAEINALNPDGWTNMVGGIAQANLVFQTRRQNATWAMILLTDGVANWWDGATEHENETYRRTIGAQKAIYEATITQQMGVKIFTIGLGSKDYLNEDLLKQIQTNGYFFAPSAQDLDRIYQAIAQELTYDVRYDVILIKIALRRA